MTDGVRKATFAQILISLAAGALAGMLGGADAAGAAVLGGGIALANTLLLGRRVRQAGGAAANDARGRGVATLYWGLMERFAVAAAGFALGIAGLGLPPLPMVATFALAQLGVLAAASYDPSRAGQRTSKRDSHQHESS
jgi:ATP synthase protein I